MQNTEERNTAVNYDFEMPSLDDSNGNTSTGMVSFWVNARFLVAGIFFGILLVKSQVISWFRIQEMFRLQSFHMYGVIGSAVLTGMFSIWLIKKARIKTIDGKPIEIKPKKFSIGQVYGGLLFGLGWVLTGACPGPLYAQLGTGALVTIIPLLSAVAGTWLYGWMFTRLPH